jgi:hypothetical protein
MHNELINHINNLLASDANRFDGRQIYHIQQSFNISQGDESELSQVILHTYSNSIDTEYGEQELIIYNLLLDINPNDLLPEDEQLLWPYIKIEQPDISISGCQPILYINRYNNSFTIHGTDNTIYITQIESGQH